MGGNGASVSTTGPWLATIPELKQAQTKQPRVKDPEIILFLLLCFAMVLLRPPQLWTVFIIVHVAHPAATQLHSRVLDG